MSFERNNYDAGSAPVAGKRSAAQEHVPGSTSAANIRESHDAGKAQDAAAPMGDRLAHELANLLDGSLRNISLVMDSLRDDTGSARSPDATGPTGPEQPNDDPMQRLEAVNQGLRQMAALVHRWMQKPKDAVLLHRDSRNLGQIVNHAVRLLMPAAMLRRIDIVVDLPEEVATLPAGPLYPIIANALRNSIEAITRDINTAHRGGRIELTGRIDAKSVEIAIADDGPGLDPTLLENGCFNFGKTTKPEGHGLGLSLAREIAGSMGGSLELVNRPTGGAVMRLRYPR